MTTVLVEQPLSLAGLLLIIIKLFNDNITKKIKEYLFILIRKTLSFNRKLGQLVSALSIYKWSTLG